MSLRIEYTKETGFEAVSGQVLTQDYAKWLEYRLQTITNLLREKSRELAPDYPKITEDMDPWEHLWALTTSLGGTRAANDDTHKYAMFLIKRLGWTIPQALQEFKNEKA